MRPLVQNFIEVFPRRPETSKCIADSVINDLQKVVEYISLSLVNFLQNETTSQGFRRLLN